MVEIRDLPRAGRLLQLLFEPLQLRGFYVRGLEGQELDIGSRRERVVLLALHGEQLVEPLFARVFVPQRRSELRPLIEKASIRRFELTEEVLRALTPKDVPAE